MQRNFILISFFIFTIFLLFSCGKKDDVVPEYEEYPYGNADIVGVQINGSGLVTLQPDTCNRVIRQTKGAQILKMGNSLLINGGGEVVVGCRNNFSISLNGGGVRNLDSNLYMKQLVISGQNGAVDIKNIHAEVISVGVTNTGDWQIKGTTGYLSVSTSNFGRFFGFELQTDSCVVSHSVLGDIQVNVTEKLTGGLYSTGNLFYKGHPPIVNVTAVASGHAVAE